MIVQDIADVPIQKVNTDSKRRRPKVFQCSFDGCGKSFDSQWGLTRHIRTHTKEKPFKCNYPGCGKCFSEKCGLKRHVSSHDHTKPYKCPHPGCDKTFKSRDYLDAHRRLHEEEEPYKCKINNCNRCFSSVKSLRKHQAVWHNSKGTESQVEQQLREKYLKVLQRNKERLEKMESHLHAILENNKALKLENAQYRKDHMIILGRIPKSKKALYDQETLAQSAKPIIQPGPLMQEKPDLFVTQMDHVDLDLLNEQQVAHPNLIIIPPIESVPSHPEPIAMEPEMERPPSHLYSSVC